MSEIILRIHVYSKALDKYLVAGKMEIRSSKTDISSSKKKKNTLL